MKIFYKPFSAANGFSSFGGLFVPTAVIIDPARNL